MRKFLCWACMMALATGLLFGSADAAQADEGKALFGKIANIGRSFKADIDHKRHSEAFSEVNGEAAAFCARYPDSPAKGKIEQVMAAYRDVDRLLSEAANSMEHGEDALFKDSRPYQTLAGRYPGLFDRLAGKSLRNPANGRIFYLKIDVAREINDGFAARYQEELRQVLGL